jgi:hypothetical protein
MVRVAFTDFTGDDDEYDLVFGDVFQKYGIPRLYAKIISLREVAAREVKVDVFYVNSEGKQCIHSTNQVMKLDWQAPTLIDDDGNKYHYDDGDAKDELKYEIEQAKKN